MNIEIVTKDTTITPAIETAAKDAIKKALKIQEKITNVKLTIEKTNEKAKPFKVSGIVYLKHNEIKVTKQGEDVYKLFHILSEDLTRQVRKNKEKQLHNKHQSIKNLEHSDV